MTATTAGRAPRPVLRPASGRTGRVATVAAALTVIGLTTAPSAAAADDGRGVDVVNTETVQVYLGPDGDVKSKRVYEQLVLSGRGTVDLSNPVSTSGLRNLDGFRGLKVVDGNQVADVEVDGTKRYRSVSNFDEELPAKVTPSYTLNGNKVKPGDVVGKKGRLEVSFTVENKTVKPQQLTVADGNGGTVVRTVPVPVPMVGTLETELPKTFTDIELGGANAAGDGKGGTRLSYTMTLFPPLGPTTATIGYSATITDGVVPAVEVSLVPVDPLSSPTFKTAAKSYRGGAESGAQLVAGASEIDSNLLKLRDGAGDLLAGLIKLSDGADQLHSGLATEAAPGAKKLAAGAGAALDGSKKLAAGADQLDAGAGQLHQGTSDALAGATKLNDGLGQISGGLSQLADQLPAAGPGIQRLIDGMNQIIAGFGAAGQTGTLIDGLVRINAGATQLKSGISGQIVPGIGQAKGGVDQVRTGLNEAIKPGGKIDQLLGGLDLLLTTDCGPVCQQIITTQLKPGVQQSKTDLTAAHTGLGQVSGGLQQVIDGLNGQIVPGLSALEDGSAQAKAGADKLKAGSVQVRDGLTELKTKLAAAIAGVLKLNTGASAAYAGSGDLADGLGQLDDGSGKLAAGTGELSAGAGDLTDGLGQIETGAGDLSDGLGDAADGSGQIADGLKTASGGAPQIVDGASRLSAEGMSQLKAAGAKAAVDYGTLYAEIAAGAGRAQAESMAFGAPKDAAGLTAYSFVIRGADGETDRNLARGAGAFALLALASGISVLRRRSA